MTLKTLNAIRRLPNGDVRKLIVGAINHGIRYRMTKAGIMLYGNNGHSTTIHFSVSDSRAGRNISSDLRKMGYDPGSK